MEKEDSKVMLTVISSLPHIAILLFLVLPASPGTLRCEKETSFCDALAGFPSPSGHPASNATKMVSVIQLCAKIDLSSSQPFLRRHLVIARRTLCTILIKEEKLSNIS